MDEVQVAFLRIKSPHLDRWLADRARVATRYDDALAPLGVTLDGPSLNHLYVIRVKDRDQVRRRLSAAGISRKFTGRSPSISYLARGPRPTATTSRPMGGRSRC